jgi:alkyl hydroperoxide reductase subunit AhpF
MAVANVIAQVTVSLPAARTPMAMIRPGKMRKDYDVIVVGSGAAGARPPTRSRWTAQRS